MTNSAVYTGTTHHRRHNLGAPGRIDPVIDGRRSVGRAFTPPSPSSCFARDQPNVVVFVVAEITNTPWGERCCYVLDVRGTPGPTGLDGATTALRQTSEKISHVPPFIDIHHRYSRVLTTPGPTLGLHINAVTTDVAQQRIFDATLKLTQHELSSVSPQRLLLRYPFESAQTSAYHYTEALRLALKCTPRLPHVRGARPPSYRPPHESKIL